MFIISIINARDDQKDEGKHLQVWLTSSHLFQYNDKMFISFFLMFMSYGIKLIYFIRGATLWRVIYFTYNSHKFWVLTVWLTFQDPCEDYYSLCEFASEQGLWVMSKRNSWENLRELTYPSLYLSGLNISLINYDNCDK